MNQHAEDGAGDDVRPSEHRWADLVAGAVVGLGAGALALGVAELVAGIVSTWRSPFIDVGDRVIDLAPSSVTKFAIEVFGTNDKPALLAGIGVILAIYSAVVGALAMRTRAAVGVAGFALFGVVGVLAVATKRTDPPLSATTPVVVGTLAGIGALVAGIGFVSRRRSANEPDADLEEQPDDAAVDVDRRRLLVRGGAVFAALAVSGSVAGAIGRSIRARFSATESRAAVRLPRPEGGVTTAPAGVEVGVPGVAPFHTPTDRFYRIDTALSVPQLRAEDYELRVTGKVDDELRLSFDDLLARRVVEHDITMTCVSNTVGGELVGHARWRGVRLDELLADAGVSPEATQVVGRSVDGYTCGFPIEAATDGRNALVAFGMNGEPLPLQHGFPARLVVPGLYGYVSATKWLTEIELTTFEDFDQYWVPRGYAERAPIKIQTRIDSVDGLDTLELDADGRAVIGGVAWAQTRGIGAVEVRVDDGEWQQAELGDALNDDTWRQWRFSFTPERSGRVTLSTRATDGDGNVQTADRSEPLPDGASGHHTVVVFAP